MSRTKITLITHGLSITAGVMGIVAGQSIALGIPSYVVSALGVAISVTIYVANQLPSLGSDSGFTTASR